MRHLKGRNGRDRAKGEKMIEQKKRPVEVTVGPMRHISHMHKAHDIRRLTACDVCGDLGDSERMIEGKTHTCCYGLNHEEPETVKLILALPSNERNKFTLGDLQKFSVRNARRIVESL